MLEGSAAGTLLPSSRKVAADTAFDPTTVSLRHLGLPPTSVVVRLVPAGRTTGSPTGGVLSTGTEVAVRLPVVRLFGLLVRRSAAAAPPHRPHWS